LGNSTTEAAILPDQTDSFLVIDTELVFQAFSGQIYLIDQKGEVVGNSLRMGRDYGSI